MKLSNLSLLMVCLCGVSALHTATHRDLVNFKNAVTQYKNTQSAADLKSMLAIYKELDKDTVRPEWAQQARTVASQNNVDIIALASAAPSRGVAPQPAAPSAPPAPIVPSAPQAAPEPVAPPAPAPVVQPSMPAPSAPPAPIVMPSMPAPSAPPAPPAVDAGGVPLAPPLDGTYAPSAKPTLAVPEKPSLAHVAEKDADLDRLFEMIEDDLHKKVQLSPKDRDAYIRNARDRFEKIAASLTEKAKEAYRAKFIEIREAIEKSSAVPAAPALDANKTVETIEDRLQRAHTYFGGSGYLASWSLTFGAAQALFNEAKAAFETIKSSLNPAKAKELQDKLFNLQEQFDKKAGKAAPATAADKSLMIEIENRRKSMAEDEDLASPTHAAAPSAPPMSPAPTPSAPPAPPAPSAPTPAAPNPNRGQLLEEIRKGKELNKVAAPEAAPVRTEPLAPQVLEDLEYLVASASNYFSYNPLAAPRAFSLGKAQSNFDAAKKEFKRIEGRLDQAKAKALQDKLDKLQEQFDKTGWETK